MKPRFDRRATVQALNYLASHAPGNTIGKIDALKLLYLADRDHLRKDSRTISGDEYRAMKYGPVACHTKKLIERIARNGGDGEGFLVPVRLSSRRMAIRATRPTDTDRLSKTELDALDRALAQWPSHPDLVRYTHRFPEWKKHEADIPGRKGGVPMDYLDFFLPCEDPADEYCDAGERLVFLSREIYKEELGWPV